MSDYWRDKVADLKARLDGHYDTCEDGPYAIAFDAIYALEVLVEKWHNESQSPLAIAIEKLRKPS